MTRLLPALCGGFFVLAVTVAVMLPIGALSAQCGIASWYGPGFHGRTSASGERFDQNAMTAAHKTLPFGTRVKVIDQRTGKAVSVRINDRGPYHGKRIIDLSAAAASKLGMKQAGVGKVCLERL